MKNRDWSDKSLQEGDWAQSQGAGGTSSLVPGLSMRSSSQGQQAPGRVRADSSVQKFSSEVQVWVELSWKVQLWLCLRPVEQRPPNSTTLGTSGTSSAPLRCSSWTLEPGGRGKFPGEGSPPLASTLFPPP